MLVSPCPVTLVGWRACCWCGGLPLICCGVGVKEGRIVLNMCRGHMLLVACLASARRYPLWPPFFLERESTIFQARYFALVRLRRHARLGESSGLVSTVVLVGLWLRRLHRGGMMYKLMMRPARKIG